jgi:hypothetical protein
MLRAQVCRSAGGAASKPARPPMPMLKLMPLYPPISLWGVGVVRCGGSPLLSRPPRRSGPGRPLPTKVLRVQDQYRGAARVVLELPNLEPAPQPLNPMVHDHQKGRPPGLPFKKHPTCPQTVVMPKYTVAWKGPRALVKHGREQG